MVQARRKQARQVLATGRRGDGPDPVNPQRITDLYEQAIRAQALGIENLVIMGRTMAVAQIAGQTIEMEAVLRLAPVHSVEREELEDATMEVEQVLDQHALPITGGASASANLDAGCIEIDIVLTGASMGELHQMVALIVTQLDRYCDSVRIAPLGVAQSAAAHLPLTLQGSQTRLRTPTLGPLVPA